MDRSHGSSGDVYKMISIKQSINKHIYLPMMDRMEAAALSLGATTSTK